MQLKCLYFITEVYVHGILCEDLPSLKYTMLSTYSSWESEILLPVSQWVMVKCILCRCMIGENYKKPKSETVMFNFIPIDTR